MQLLVNAAIAGSFAALMAAGLSLVYGVLGVFNMALGQFALVGGYVTWWFVAVLGLPFPLALVAGVAVSILVSWLSFEGFVAPYYKRHRFLPLVTTIALGMIIDAAIILLFREQPRSIDAGARVLLHFHGAVVSLEQLVLILVTLVFLVALAIILVGTPFGRKIRASVQHPEACESLGVNSVFLHRIVFILSGTLAALGGVYQGIDQNLTPVMAFPILIKAYAALIAGGKGSLKGTILCAYAIALLEQLAVGIPWFGFYIPAGYQSAVALVVIIVVLIVRPEGLFGSRLRTA